MAYEYREAGVRNGDPSFSVYRDGVCIGMVRDCRTGDWHSTINRKGRIVGRYFGTRQGAAQWLYRNASKGE